MYIQRINILQVSMIQLHDGFHYTISNKRFGRFCRIYTRLLILGSPAAFKDQGQIAVVGCNILEQFTLIDECSDIFHAGRAYRGREIYKTKKKTHLSVLVAYFASIQDKLREALITCPVLFVSPGDGRGEQSRPGIRDHFTSKDLILLLKAANLTSG
ncbi:hypothetical protein RRG08_018040 [Elysia crispata]|uniref:Uncharacterized protein n=1 Tax=Elysia crispata TaxID=231223 RepID=A0AAE0ZCZ9_9GAST|nr:hypothetical protein RRG08_018040 [Elysia crispata]